jgi:protein SCO1/2
MRLIWSLLILAMIVTLGCDGSASVPVEDDDLFALPDFTLTERCGQPFGLRELRGKVWVAAFTFTRCAGACTRVSGAMAQLQHEFASEPDVRLVSFTVDPEHDRPDVLSAYARKFGAQPERWYFLTGDPPAVLGLIHDGFHLAAEPNRGPERTPGNEVLHDTRLAVVDKRGHVRAYYDISDADAVARVEARLKRLLAEKG